MKQANQQTKIMVFTSSLTSYCSVICLSLAINLQISIKFMHLTFDSGYNTGFCSDTFPY